MNNLAPLSAIVLMMSVAAHSSFAADTVLPYFEGQDELLRVYQAQIARGLSAGPNFNEHYSVIAIPCGFVCRSFLIGDNQTGETFAFPYGGEEHMPLHLTYGLRSNKILVSYGEDSVYVEAQDAATTAPRYCVARELAWNGVGFEIIDTVKIPVEDESYDCDSGPEMFRMRDAVVKKYGDACHPNLTRFDVCKKAREIASELSPMLPFKMDPMTTMYDVGSDGTTVNMSARWTMSANELRSAMASDGLDQSALQEKMRRATRQIVCGNELTRAFIGLGGSIQYNYHTQDSSRFAIVKVSDCH